MARHSKDPEGDDTERRKRAKAARERGESPSEAGVTRGASKQREEVRQSASHDERMETRDKGKRGAGTSGKPRPGNRATDPKRTNRWE
jgi:hypothetical protein